MAAASGSVKMDRRTVMQDTRDETTATLLDWRAQLVDLTAVAFRIGQQVYVGNDVAALHLCGDLQRTARAGIARIDKRLGREAAA